MFYWSCNFWFFCVIGEQCFPGNFHKNSRIQIAGSRRTTALEFKKSSSVQEFIILLRRTSLTVRITGRKIRLNFIFPGWGVQPEPALIRSTWVAHRAASFTWVALWSWQTIGQTLVLNFEVAVFIDIACWCSSSIIKKCSWKNNRFGG